MKLGSLVVVGEVVSVKENGSYFIVKCVIYRTHYFFVLRTVGRGENLWERGSKMMQKLCTQIL